MSTASTFEVLSIPTPATPRGARAAAELFNAVRRAVGRLAAPAVLRPGTRAEEAEQVRSLARSMQHTDPGFAADLYAAAARHEGLNG